MRINKTKKDILDLLKYMELSEAGRPLNITEIKRFVGRSYPRILDNLKSLEKIGWIKIDVKINEKHRPHMVSLSEKGDLALTHLNIIEGLGG